MSKPKVFIVGVGMTKFEKPGKRDWDYPDMVKEAVTMALADSKLQYSDVQQAAVGYIYGGTCCGQRCLYELGFTGIPIFNVNNACASGSSGVFLCKQIIESGNADCVLACGFERMGRGSLENQQTAIDDRATSADKHLEVMQRTFGMQAAPFAAQMFGNAGIEHMRKYDWINERGKRRIMNFKGLFIIPCTKREHFAKIAHKNHLHSVHNENSQFRKAYSMEEILNAKKIYEFLGLLECSPTSEGSAAVILCSESFLRKNPRLRKQAVEIRVANNLYKETGYGPKDVQVIELHDCFSPNELITYEAIGLCPVGKAGELIDRNDNTYGGKWVVNPSGGLISKGHPIGATGVAQVVELSNQLRGRCGKRQVPNARLALQHNIGLGGACVMGMYKLAVGAMPEVPLSNKI
ncbi:hypothetical protein PRIPAC_79366 [Pristionchus pacificus]|uniref:propanoyl-CoA C-acyltransferase n=1 Tax=Pristionchus pacificus TaxID=54126 RepID=A0A2A6CM63_PRIPA|nr:hypothetical protein PRIPAC_79366 [Pristionchus pacificus]|eukprot:PDM79335.1 daf-22.2 [Pristionchus pacificus]